MERNKAARTIQARWRSTSRPKYVNPFTKTLGTNITLAIVNMLPPENRRAFLNATRPPSNIERALGNKKYTKEKERRQKRRHLRDLLYSAARVGRVVPSGPHDRLYNTLRTFVIAKRKLKAGGKITRWGYNKVTSNENQAVYRRAFIQEYKNILKHIRAPNSNYSNNKPPRHMNIAIWHGIPMHMRRWVKFVHNDLRNTYDETPSRMSHMSINGNNIRY